MWFQVLLNGWFREQMTGGLVSCYKRIEKKLPLLAVKVTLSPINIWLSSQIHMYLLQHLVTNEGGYVFLWTILKVACPKKLNALYIVQILTKVCIFLKRPVSSEGHFNVSYNSILKPHAALALSETCASIRRFATKANKKNEGG